MFSVLVNDSGAGGYDNNAAYFAEISVWASTHCASYVDYHVQDVSDVSYQFDEIAEYRFEDEQDVFMFKLKYGV